MKDKKPEIYTVDYCHGDFSWTNPRSWHIERYLSSIIAALDDTAKHTDYVYLFDNYAHQLEVFLKYCPERKEQFDAAVRAGRLVFAEGGYSLGRPGWLQAEAYVRNLLDGQKKLRKLSGRKSRFFFNADTAAGHSQMPQILSQAGYEFYMFYRPEKLLNGKGVPKQFYWQGADGSTVLVNRGYYGTLSYDSAFRHGTSYENAKAAFEKDFSEQAYKNETGIYFMPAGCDDVIPGLGIGDVPADMAAFMKAMQEHGDGTMRYAPPEMFFDRLQTCDLPTYKGKLYDCELSYNVPFKSPKYSLYCRRHALSYRLLALERLYAVASMRGVSVNTSAVQKLWMELHEISGHAGEMAIWDDLKYLLDRADSALLTAKKLYEETLDELAGLVCGEGDYLVFYPAPRYNGTAEAEITSAFGASPTETEDGRTVQVIETNRPDKKYASFQFSAVRGLFNADAEGIGFEVVRFKNGAIKPFHPRESLLKTPKVMDAGCLRLTLNASGICAVDGSDFHIEGPFGSLSMRHTRLSETWLPEFTFMDSVPCVFRKVRTEYDGPIGLKFTLIGRLGKNPVYQTVTVDKRTGRMDFETRFISERCSADYSAVFPCTGSMRAGIPFGAEDRIPETDICSDDYEQNLPGNIYANGFMAFEAGGTRIILAATQGHKLLQAEKGILRLLLLHDPGSLEKHTLPTEQWMKNLRTQDGENRFTWSVAIGLDDADAATFYESANLPPVVVKNHRRGRPSQDEKFYPVQIKQKNALVTAFYKDGEEYLVRLYEAAGSETPLCVKIPGYRVTAETLSKQAMAPDRLQPYRIVTLRLIPEIKNGNL